MDSSESKVSRSYTPLSFYMDSAGNHPGPIRMDNKSYLCKNYVLLSLYTTPLVYYPAESKMDIFVSGKEKVSHELSFYMDPTLSLPARKNYIRQSSQSSQSESKVIFRCQTSPSTANIIFGSFGCVAKLSTKSKVIPDKLYLSILSKLPVKSLRRFGCIRKSWSTLFDNPDFMTVYTNHFLSRHGSHNDYRTFILTNHRLQHRLYHSEFHLLDNNRLELNLPSPLQQSGLELNLPSPLQQSGYRTCILGSTSVNGILCLGQLYPGRDSKSQYVLWNPATHEFMVIPSSPAERTPKHPCAYTVFIEHIFHGFGYDKLRDDFKVVHYVSFVSHSYPRLTTTYFEIYSLKTNSWRMIDMENDLSHWCYIHSMPFSGRELYLDGACHWLVSNDSTNNQRGMTLLSFHLTSEMFITTPIGEEPLSPYSCVGCLTVLNGSIALISNYHNDIVFQISILGELGVTESWIKLYTYGPLPSFRWPPIGFGKMGHTFFRKKDYQVAYVDLSTQTIEEVGITGEKTSSFITGLYKESLVSLEDHVNSFSSSFSYST